MKLAFLPPVALLLCPLASSQLELREIWIEGTGTPSLDELLAMTGDGAGGAYVGGTTIGNLAGPNSGATDGFIRSLDADGNEVWAVQFGSVGFENVFGLCTDPATGDVLACGVTSGTLAGTSQGGQDAFIARFDASGQQLWLVQFGGPDQDAALDIIEDGAGGFWVAGATTGSLGGPNAGDFDVFFASVDASGTVSPAIQLGTPERENAVKIASDGAGGFFLSCSTDGSLGGPSAGGSDAYLARFDATGMELWSQQLGSTGNDSNFFLASDGAGGVHVTGVAQGNLAGTSAGGRDLVIGRFDGAGAQLHLAQSGTANDEAGLGIAWDPSSDRVFVAGNSNGNPGDDVVVTVLTPAGQVLASQNLGSSGDDLARGVVPTGSGGVLIGGSTFGDLGGPNQGFTDIFSARLEPEVGRTRCTPAVANSTGSPAVLRAWGSNVAANGNLRLCATQLPPQQFGLFFNSQTLGMVPGAGGSQGVLCATVAIGRYDEPNEIQNSGAQGAFELVLDLDSTPTANGFVQIAAGQTWYFQGWYRDVNPTATSNFTDTVQVTFQ